MISDHLTSLSLNIDKAAKDGAETLLNMAMNNQDISKLNISSYSFKAILLTVSQASRGQAVKSGVTPGDIETVVIRSQKRKSAQSIDTSSK